MRTTIHAALLLCLATPLAAQTGGGAFVIRLGRDTFGIERFERSAARLEGDLLLRAPATVMRHYVVTFDSTGRMTRYELGVHRYDPGASPVRIVVEFSRDSAVTTLTRGDSTRTWRSAAPATTLPYLFLSTGVFQELTRRARATAQPVDTLTVMGAGDDAPSRLVASDAGDSVAMVLEGDTEPFMYAVAHDGTVLGMSGLRTTDKELAEPAQFDFEALKQAFAHRPLGATSPADSVNASVRGIAVRIEYNRPSLRGRSAVGGLLVPWNQVWRTGANAATRFTTAGDLLVAGRKIPAGTYTLFTLPSPTGWKLIVSKETKSPTNPRRPLWGTDYNPDSDLVRVDMKVESAAPVEQFTIGVAPQGAGATLWMSWEKTRVSVPLAKP